MQVRSLSGKDPLENEMVTHSTILAWRNPHQSQSQGICMPEKGATRQPQLDPKKLQPSEYCPWVASASSPRTSPCPAVAHS